MTRFLIILAFALVNSTGAQADGLAYKRILIGKIGMERDINAFEERLRAEFQRLDADEDGAITHDDLATALNFQMAEARARYMLSWLRNDVDGDLAITSQELRQSVRFRSLSQGGRGAFPSDDKVAANIEKRITERLEIDENEDGTISIDELLTAAKTQAMKVVANDRAQTLPGEDLDLNCDRMVTETEFVSVFREVFELTDQDGDGAISRAEFTIGLSRAVMDDFTPTGADKCDPGQK